MQMIYDVSAQHQWMLVMDLTLPEFCLRTIRPRCMQLCICKIWISKSVIMHPGIHAQALC